MQANQHDLRVMVRGAYDLQKLRIQMGNRIVGNFKAKLGQAPGESEDDALDAEGKKILFASWNGNAPKWIYERQATKYRAKNPND